MKTICIGWIIALLFLFQSPASILAGPQAAHSKKTANSTAGAAFEPLERWKAAVESGNRTDLASFYTTSPPARAKTPRGETVDPSEEPAFWSSLHGLGISRVDPKVLEVKHLQPGVVAVVLRIELELGSGAAQKEAVVSGAQVWLQQQGDWRIVSTQRSDLAAMPTMRLPQPAKPNIQLYPEPEEASGEIATALRAATKDHKRVLLIFGGNWCYDCHVLDATFRSKSIAPLVNENYHVVHVNVGDYDKNIDLAKKYEIPLDKGVPSLAILDGDGKLIVSQKKGEFESTVRIGPEDIVQFLKQWKPPHSPGNG
jgi:thioredoxin 1